MALFHSQARHHVIIRRFVKGFYGYRIKFICHFTSMDFGYYQGALAIRRVFSLVDMITKPKFSNCPNIFKIGLFR